jgi:hypothetical protein
MSFQLIREILEEQWNPMGPSAPTGANANARGRQLADLRPMLRGTPLIVAIVIATHADNETRLAWPGIERLARLTRRSRRAVYRAIGTLRRLGVLEIIKGGAARFGSPGDLYKFRSPVMESVEVFAASGKSAASGKCAASGTKSVPLVALKLPEGTIEGEEVADDELLARCRALFRMRPTRKLDTAQERAWRKAVPMVAETEADEWIQMEAYYTADLPRREDFRRKDLATLLNNWSGELTRARDWCRKVGWTPPQQAEQPPADWVQLVGIVLERDYPDAPRQTFPAWAAVPDWLRGEVRTAAGDELARPAPAEWAEAVEVMQQAGELSAGEVFNDWQSFPVPTRLQIRTVIENAAGS